MKILLVKRPNNFISHLISEVTGEPESHVAIEFDCGLVMDSSATGVHIKPASYFRKKTQVLRELVPVAKIPDKIAVAISSPYWGKFYDYGALLYLAVVFSLRNYLNIPLPKKNLWHDSGMFMCTEFVSMVVDGKQDPLITPTKLGDRLLQSGQWRKS